MEAILLQQYIERIVHSRQQTNENNPRISRNEPFQSSHVFTPRSWKMVCYSGGRGMLSSIPNSWMLVIPSVVPHCALCGTTWRPGVSHALYVAASSEYFSRCTLTAAGDVYRSQSYHIVIPQLARHSGGAVPAEEGCVREIYLGSRI